MKKIILGLVIVGLIGGSALASVSTAYVPVGSGKIYNKTNIDLKASSAIWSTAVISKRAYVSDIVVSAVAASIVTITDAETTPNTLMKLHVLAGDTVSVKLNVPLTGSLTTTISALQSVYVAASSTACVTLIGWER